MWRTILGVFVGLGVLWGMSAMTAAQTRPASAIYITNSDIQATLRRAPADSATDQPVRMVDAGKTNVGVGVVYRSAKAAQSAVEHDQLTEIYQILEGSGTLMTGGAVVATDGKATTHDATGPSGPSLRGTALRGGESRRVGPGDVVIIPAGVGHIFSAIEGTAGNGIIKYLVVRVDPDKVLPLK